MATYINKEQARLEAKRYFKNMSEVQEDLDMIFCMLPAEDVSPVRHGRWEHSRTYYELDECNCSLCGQLMTTAIDKRMNYCPNCGAKMDGDG